jgi:hypothetical protein
MQAKSPKDFLSQQQLIGFRRPAKGGGQMPHRASSAKVTAIEPNEPAKRAELKNADDKSSA